MHRLPMVKAHDPSIEHSYGGRNVPLEFPHANPGASSFGMLIDQLRHDVFHARRAGFGLQPRLQNEASATLVACYDQKDLAISP